MDGQIHTNGYENFWSLLSADFMEPTLASNRFISFRYLDEQMFRYNNRATKEQFIGDGDRFEMVMSQIIGKRLTYKEVTGKEGETRAD